jgi:hypothetical protein
VTPPSDTPQVSVWCFPSKAGINHIPSTTFPNTTSNPMLAQAFNCKRVFCARSHGSRRPLAVSAIKQADSNMVTLHYFPLR